MSEDLPWAARRTVALGSRWRHWKGGVYVIVANGFEEATGHAVVVYQSETTGVVWTRPLDNFLGKVESEGAPAPSVYRFELIAEAI